MKEYKFIVVRTQIQKLEMWGTGETLAEAQADAESAVIGDAQVMSGGDTRWETVEENDTYAPVEVKDQ